MKRGKVMYQRVTRKTENGYAVTISKSRTSIILMFIGLLSERVEGWLWRLRHRTKEVVPLVKASADGVQTTEISTNVLDVGCYCSTGMMRMSANKRFFVFG